MRVAIVNNCVPFIYGGAEFLADSLKEKLIEHGHQAAVIKIPFKWNPPQKILEHMLACRLLRVENIDKVIALKFPAYYIKHPNKELWLLHQFRQAYDLWGTPYQDLPSTPDGLRIREAIIQADNSFLREANGVFTISKVVTDRLKRFNGISSEVLYPPLRNPERYHENECGDYLFYPSRISRGKRQGLAIEAMKYTESDVKLIIAGNPDAPEDLEYIKSIVKKNRLESKVNIMGKWITEEDKIELIANSLGCLFIPYNEDYGYVSLEAYHSKKSVITCRDSGGTLEFVEDGVSGFVVTPEPEAIASAMDRLFYSKELSKRMGQAGFEKLRSMNINWDHVIERLVG
jgi:glycosyltransferase involved in cell wall biosynthesis